MADENKGWHNDPQGHAKAGAMSSGNTGNPQQHAEAGQKGGVSSQQSGNAHELTQDERSLGGSLSGGNFANDPQRASEAGHKGGSK